MHGDSNGLLLTPDIEVGLQLLDTDIDIRAECHRVELVHHGVVKAAAYAVGCRVEGTSPCGRSPIILSNTRYPARTVAALRDTEAVPYRLLVHLSPRDRADAGASLRSDFVALWASPQSSLQIVGALGMHYHAQRGATMRTCGWGTAFMPRSSEIGRFGEKLGLMQDRLSLSRVQLAQAAGVDKSVAARWISGRVRPSDQSIVRLTDLVRRQITDFARSDWDLTLAEFATRLGMTAPKLPDQADAAWLPELAENVSLYGGLWLLTHCSFTGMPRLFGFLLDLQANDGSLGFELGDGFGYRARGAVVIDAGKLCLHGDAVMHPHQVWPIYLVLNGVQIYRAAVIDGLMLSWCRDIGRTPTVLRTIGWRLAPHAPDPVAARRRFEAAAGHIAAENRAGRLQDYLPAWVRSEIFDLPSPPVHGALRVPVERSLAVEEMTLGLVEPPDGPRRQVLSALRALFAPVLDPV
jgi:transcriptional regulator with XRE-family HTH domain